MKNMTNAYSFQEPNVCTICEPNRVITTNVRFEHHMAFIHDVRTKSRLPIFIHRKMSMQDGDYVLCNKDGCKGRVYSHYYFNEHLKFEYVKNPNPDVST